MVWLLAEYHGHIENHWGMMPVISKASCISQKTEQIADVTKPSMWSPLANTTGQTLPSCSCATTSIWTKIHCWNRESFSSHYFTYIYISFYHKSKIKGEEPKGGCRRAGIQQNSLDFPFGRCASSSVMYLPQYSTRTMWLTQQQLKLTILAVCPHHFCVNSQKHTQGIQWLELWLFLFSLFLLCGLGNIFSTFFTCSPSHHPKKGERHLVLQPWSCEVNSTQHQWRKIPSSESSHKLWTPRLHHVMQAGIKSILKSSSMVFFTTPPCKIFLMVAQINWHNYLLNKSSPPSHWPLREDYMGSRALTSGYLYQKGEI